MSGTFLLAGGRLSLAALLTLALAAVHLGAGRLDVAGRVPRSGWLSFAGGTSIAYVFVHLLPELEAGGRAIETSDGLLAAFFERHVYLVALVGFVAFYGLERFVAGARRDDRTSPVSETGVFWVHVGSFAVYNALVGYSLHRRETALAAALFAVAMAFHFLVNDVGLSDAHAAPYDRVGRWVLAVAVVAGSAVGALVHVDEALYSVVLAFLAGGVVLNVVKEELPEERESRFSAFVVGATAYTGVLLAL